MSGALLEHANVPDELLLAGADVVHAPAQLLMRALLLPDPLLGAFDVRAAPEPESRVRDETAFATTIPIREQPAEFETRKRTV